MLDRDTRWRIMAELTESGARDGFIAVGGFWAVQTLFTGDGLTPGGVLGALMMGLGAGLINGVLLGALFGWAVAGLVLALDAPSRFSAALNGASLHGAFGGIIAFAVGRTAAAPTLGWVLAGWLVFTLLGARFGALARGVVLRADRG